MNEKDRDIEQLQKTLHKHRAQFAVFFLLLATAVAMAVMLGLAFIIHYKKTQPPASVAATYELSVLKSDGRLIVI